MPELPEDHWIIRSNKGTYTRGEVDVLEARIKELMPEAETSRERDYGFALDVRHGDVIVTAVQPERRSHPECFVYQERIFLTPEEVVSELRRGGNAQG